jgi:hypothetical protein
MANKCVTCPPPPPTGLCTLQEHEKLWQPVTACVRSRFMWPCSHKMDGMYTWCIFVEPVFLDFFDLYHKVSNVREHLPQLSLSVLQFQSTTPTLFMGWKWVTSIDYHVSTVCFWLPWEQIAFTVTEVCDIPTQAVVIQRARTLKSLVNKQK